MQTITLKLPEALLRTAQAIAIDRDETVAKIVEDLLVREFSSWTESKRRDPTDERLVFALQKLLFRDMAEATGWDDLSDRLEKHGYWLKLTREGLVLHTETNGRWICNCADLGFGYVTFVRRFGAGVPRDPYAREQQLPQDFSFGPEQIEVNGY